MGAVGNPVSGGVLYLEVGGFKARGSLCGRLFSTFGVLWGLDAVPERSVYMDLARKTKCSHDFRCPF